MWYLHSNDDPIPAGSVIDTFTMDGVTWDLYFKVAGFGWDFYTFVPKDKSVCKVVRGVLKCNMLVTVHKYFEFLIDEGYVVGDEWVEGLEVGNEIAGGCTNSTDVSEGTTVVRKFDVAVDI